MIEMVFNEYELMQIRMALMELVGILAAENRRLEIVDAMFFANIITANSRHIDELMSLKNRISVATQLLTTYDQTPS